MKETKYPGLYVTESGEVYSNTRGPIRKLAQYPDGGGYIQCSYKGMSKKVHRLVAETFIDNPDNLPQIDHLDRDLNNNAMSNLEWVTCQENNERAHAKHYTLEFIETGEIIEIFNLKKFARENNLNHAHLIHTKNPTGKRGGRWKHKGWRVLNAR